MVARATRDVSRAAVVGCEQPPFPAMPGLQERARAHFVVGVPFHGGHARNSCWGPAGAPPGEGGLCMCVLWGICVSVGGCVRVGVRTRCSWGVVFRGLSVASQVSIPVCVLCIMRVHRFLFAGSAVWDFGVLSCAVKGSL